MEIDTGKLSFLLYWSLTTAQQGKYSSFTVNPFCPAILFFNLLEETKTMNAFQKNRAAVHFIYTCDQYINFLSFYQKMLLQIFMFEYFFKIC